MADEAKITAVITVSEETMEHVFEYLGQSYPTGGVDEVVLVREGDECELRAAA